MKTKQLVYTAMFTALICISALIKIPAGPVPITFQTTAVLVSGYCLGSKYGGMSVIIYILMGLAGIPVFTGGGGPAYVLSPTFGYLAGFVFSALLIGFLRKFTGKQSFPAVYAAMILSLIGIYVPGLIWLAISLKWIASVPPSFATILKTGFVLPIISDLFKTIPAALIAPRLRKILS